MIIRKNFYKYINKNKINNDKKLNVVITFGGSDPMNYTEKVLSHINYIKIPNVAFKILVPLNKKHKFFDFKNKYNLAPFINIYFDPKNLVSIFKNADLVICGGGGTLYNLLLQTNFSNRANIREKEVIDFSSKIIMYIKSLIEN